MKGHDRSPETTGYALNRWRERGSIPMVRTNPADASNNGPVGELAQLVERCDRTAEVRGSSPLFSTEPPPPRGAAPGRPEGLRTAMK